MTTDRGFIIEKALAVIDEKGNYTKEINLVSWNGRPTKYDLRAWFLDEEGQKRPTGKGMTMTEKAAYNLAQALNKVLFGFEIESAELLPDGSIKVLPVQDKPIYNTDHLYTDEDIKRDVERAFNEEMKADDNAKGQNR